MANSTPFELSRFIDAQAPVYATALAELRAGRKTSHWIWYVLPQLRGLGRSHLADLYGIASLDEARAYLAHPVLGRRLRECVQAIAAHGDRSAVEILGTIDAAKYRSCLTLFDLAAPQDPGFADELRRRFGAQPDPLTVALLR